MLHAWVVWLMVTIDRTKKEKKKKKTTTGNRGRSITFRESRLVVAVHLNLVP